MGLEASRGVQPVKGENEHVVDGHGVGHRNQSRGRADSSLDEWIVLADGWLRGREWARRAGQATRREIGNEWDRSYSSLIGFRETVCGCWATKKLCLPTSSSPVEIRRGRRGSVRKEP